MADQVQVARCGRREYVGDGVFYECRLAYGHECKHDYGWGIGRIPPPLGE